MPDEKKIRDYTKRTPGEIVRIRREDLNYSQMQLSLLIGRTVQQVNRIEKNTTNPTIDTVIRLEEILKIPLFPAFIEYQKHKHAFKPDLSEIILMTLSNHELTESELRCLFEKVIKDYLKK